MTPYPYERRTLMAKHYHIPDKGFAASGINLHTGNIILTPERARVIDEEENRIRISGTEMEAQMAMIAAGNLVVKAVPILEALAKHAGELPRLRRAVTDLRKGVIALNRHIAARQMQTIANQMTNASITISPHPVGASVCIPLEDLLHICNRATETCSFSCMVSREESKACRLRHALDLVPGCKEASKEIARSCADRCPYRDVQMEEDDLDG